MSGYSKKVLPISVAFAIGVLASSVFAIVVPNYAWGVNFHTWAPDAAFDINRANAAFDYILDLGGEYVRTDISWKYLEPVNDSWDQDMINFFNDYINAANTKGLFVVAILTHPPQWALDLYNSGDPQFWVEYQEYVQKVCQLYGDRIYYYQMWNEANHFNDPIDSADDWKLFYYAGKTIAQYDADGYYKRIINVFCNTTGWTDAVDSWLASAGDYIDVIGIDHYPGTWAAGDGSDWYPLDWLSSYITDPTSNGYGKEGAIMETGYSSWAWLQADESDQENWVNTALPIIRDKVYTHNTTYSNDIILGTIYELVDNDTNGGPDPEDHFGYLHSDWYEVGDSSKKLAYDDLKIRISEFYQ